MVMEKVDGSNIDVLDGLRALSIIAVLSCHMIPIGPSSWQGNVTVGIMGMSVFFCLSGFLITKSIILDPSIKTFFIKRLARIAPLVILVSFLYAIVLEERTDTFIGANLYILNYWHSAMIPSVGPFWSLGVEMHFYIIIGIVVFLFRRAMLPILIVLSILVTTTRIITGTFHDIPTHLRVDEILSGAILAFAWSIKDDPKAKPIWSALPLLLVPSCILWLLSSWPGSGWMGYLRPYATAVMMGSIMSIPMGLVKSILCSGPLKYVATISFALYVWHSPFRFGWFDAADVMERYLIRRPIGIICVLLLSHVSTFYFERPISKYFRQSSSNSKS